MKDMKTQKILCYLGAGLFLIDAGDSLINVISHLDSITFRRFFLVVMGILSAGLMAFGLATKKKEFCLFGAGVGALLGILTTVFNLKTVFFWLENGYWLFGLDILIASIRPVVSGGILTYIAYSGSKQKNLPILCAILNAAVALILMCTDYHVDWVTISDWVAQVLAGFALMGMEQKIPAPVIRTAQKVTPAATGPDKFERLKQLKGLLDMGAITQEEFEQKKKEIINS